jgi:hypothetical protein
MQQTQELEAFCRSCQAHQEVMTVLHTMGFTQVFHMSVVIPAAYSGVAPLHAQYHYEGPDVIYNLRPFPGKPHQKQAQNIHNRGNLLIIQMRDNLWNGSDLPGRYGAGRRGANACGHERAVQMLSSAWPLTWLSLEKLLVENPSALEAVA